MSSVLASLPLEAIGGGVNGVWQIPAEKWDGRAVLLLHGLADSSEGVAGIGRAAAEALADRGIASLRINFRGEGDRSGPRIESTLHTRLADVSAALSALRSRPGLDAGRLGVIGFSLGAVSAFQTAAQDPDTFRSIVVWSAPGGDLSEPLTPALAAAALQARQSGWAEADLGWAKLEFSHQFFESFRGVHTDRLLADYHGAFLAIRGSADFLPQADVRFLEVVAGRPAEAVLLAGADHIFQAFDPELGYRGRVIEATVEWFERTLVAR